MQISISPNSEQLGKAAARKASSLIKDVIEQQGSANLILATGASQFEMLKELVEDQDIDWTKTNIFHLDEYLDLSEDHPASFRKYLKERFIFKVKGIHSMEGQQQKPDHDGCFFPINGEQDAVLECDRLNTLIRNYPIDVAMIGIGENGHLAFNDPPADFETDTPYIIVDLDEACRKQQFGEGWFPELDAVPRKAISMSIQQIMLSSHLIVSVPDERKANAVKEALKGSVTPAVPASILQRHASCHLFLDQASASLL